MPSPEELTTLVLVPGAGRASRSEIITKWLPRLHAALGTGWKIAVPEMPNPESPDAGDWLRTVRKSINAMDGRVCLAGHSLAGSVLLQYAAREWSGQGSLFVVAAPFWCGYDSEWHNDPFKLREGDIQALQSFRLCFYHGMVDDIVPFRHLQEYQRVFPDAGTRSYAGMNHFDPADAFLQDLATDVLACAGMKD